jgi:glycogen(starch) synthase
MRIVSVTPLPAELDSRAYRLASSISRLGHESVLVEGQGSINLDGDLHFELISAGPDRARATTRPIAEPAAAEATALRAPPPWPLRAVPLAIRRLPRSAWGLLHRMRKGSRAVIDRVRANARIYRALPAADLYYLNSFELFPAVRLASVLRRAPFVYDAHDAYFEVYAGLRRSEWPADARVFAALERICIRQAAAFVSTSDGLGDLLEARHGRRPLVIRNLPDPRLDEEVEDDLRRLLGLGESHFLCVVIGNAKAGTTGEQALQALAELPETFHLAFVGQQHGPYGELIERLGLGSRAHLVEPVSPTRVTGFIRTADASAILHRTLDANYANLIPLRLFHAIAAGLPLIYGPQPGLESVVDQRQLGVRVEPDDPEQIAGAMLKLSDPDFNRELRANVERAREELRWERQEDLLANLLSSPRVDGRLEPGVTP